MGFFITIFLHFFAKQTIHIKCQIIFSLKNKIKNFRMLSATTLLSALTFSAKQTTTDNSANSVDLDVTIHAISHTVR